MPNTAVVQQFDPATDPQLTALCQVYTALAHTVAQLPTWTVPAYRDQGRIQVLNRRRFLCRWCGGLEQSSFGRTGQQFCSNRCAAQHKRAGRLAVLRPGIDSAMKVAAKHLRLASRYLDLHEDHASECAKHIRAAQRRLAEYLSLLIRNAGCLHTRIDDRGRMYADDKRGQEYFTLMGWHSPQSLAEQEQRLMAESRKQLR